MTVQRLLEKAERNLRPATVLLQDEDRSGACNRAYYAVFDAAKAALLVIHPAPEISGIKTHAGLITAFGLHLVKTGRAPSELGRIFGRVEHARILADYSDGDITSAKADQVLRQATVFVAAMRELVGQNAPGRGGSVPAAA